MYRDSRIILTFNSECCFAYPNLAVSAVICDESLVYCQGFLRVSGTVLYTYQDRKKQRAQKHDSGPAKRTFFRFRPVGPVSSYGYAPSVVEVVIVLVCIYFGPIKRP